MKKSDIEKGIIEAFDEIWLGLQKLSEHVKDDLAMLPLWVDNGAGELVTERSRAIEAIKHIKMSEGLRPQETLACVGAIGCKKETLLLLSVINQAKDKFKGLVQLYLAHYQADKSRDTSVIRDLLASHGYAQVKLKQIYRHIQYVNYHPRRISFNYVSHSSQKAVSKAKAEKLLMAVGQGENIEVQLRQLQSLDSKERLVIYHEMNCWVASVATFKNEYGRSKTEQLRTSIPLFYVHDTRLPLPAVAFAKKYEREQTGARADKLIDETAFLPSIRAFRYR